MSFLLSKDLQDFSDVLRKLFASRSGSAPDDSLWVQLGEVGAFSAALPEAAGGLGLGALASEVVLEEAGRVLSPFPILETLALLKVIGEEPRTTLGDKILAAVSEGKAALTSVLFGHAENFSQGSKGVKGKAGRVPALAKSDWLLVPVISGKKSALFAVDTALVKSTPAETLDLGRDYTDVTLSDTPGEAVIEKFSLEKFRVVLAVYAAAELCGIAGRVVEMTVEYVKTRQQFGRPIGSFQAIQHKLADMHMRAEQAQSLSRFAAWALDSDSAQSETAAIAAKAFASEFVPQLIEQSIQAHGGIGFTYEYDLHRYLRRALMLARGMLPPGECQELLGESFLQRY